MTKKTGQYNTFYTFKKVKAEVIQPGTIFINKTYFFY